MVARKEAALGFEMRNFVTLVHLALVSVFEMMWMAFGGFAGAVVPQSYDMVREAIRARTGLLPGLLLGGGEGDACNPSI